MKKTIDIPGVGEKIECWGNNKAFYFEWAEMYNPPIWNLMKANELANYFGTMEVWVQSDISEPGCETCDWGSRYGYTIEVKNATVNNPF